MSNVSKFLMSTVAATAIAATITGCGSSSTPTGGEQLPSLEGRVIDNAIPNAKVTLIVNEESVAVADADSEGYYNINYDFSALNDSDVVSLESVDPINSKNAFISVIGTGAALKKGLEGDNKVDSSDIPDTSVSNVTTAKYMCAASNGKITSVDDLISYEKVMEDKGGAILTTAAAIKYSVDENKALTIDGNSSMTMSQFAETVCTQYDQNNSSALSDISETVASYVEGVTKTDIETMNGAIMDPNSNPELAANTVKPGMTATQLDPGTYETITMEASHYKDRESYADKHPSTYLGPQDTVTVSLFDTTITADELSRFDFPLAYTNGIVIQDMYMENEMTLTYNSSDKLISVADMDSYGVIQTVQDANGYTSFSGFDTQALDWSGAYYDNTNTLIVDPSVNNYFLRDDGFGGVTVTDDPTLANGISKDWNLTNEKIETTISGIMTGTGVSSMPVSVVAGDQDIDAVDASISILQSDGSWKQVALNLATDGSTVPLGAGKNQSDYPTMTLDGISLPMTFALEFEAPDAPAKANPLRGNISDGTTTDEINEDQSFFKDGFLYLQTLTTNLGYNHIIIDLVNNVGYAFTDYVQVSIDADGIKDGNTAPVADYWTVERTKVNFVR